MKIPILHLLFLFTTLSLKGQYGSITPHQMDSLTQVVATTKIDTAKHDALFWLGIATQFNNPYASENYFNEALRLARKIDHKDRILGDLVTLGFLYGNIGEPAKGIDLLLEAVQRIEGSKQHDDPSMAYAFLAYNYEAQGDFENAIDYARRSYLFYEKRLKDKSGIDNLDERGYPAGPMRMGQLFEKMG